MGPNDHFAPRLQGQLSLLFWRYMAFRPMSYSPSPLTPDNGDRSGLCRGEASVIARLVSPTATMPSADFSHAVRKDCSSLSRSNTTHERPPGVKHQNVPCVDAGFIKHTPNADGGLRCHVPTRPECTTPQIRFLYVAPHFWIGLPPDPTSR